MPRSIWNGAIAFGAVTVPVKVFGALEDRSIHFHEVHVKDGGGIEHRLVSSDSGREVKRENVVKGYEVSNGEWVVLSNVEIKAADPPERKAVEVENFVPGEQIDPVYYDKAYTLAPQSPPTTCSRRCRRASTRRSPTVAVRRRASADGSLAVARIAVVRARQRAGRALQRGPRPRRALQPAPRRHGRTARGQARLQE